MTRKNQLLIPELRELLAAQDTEALRLFCGDGNPVVAAELIAALEPAEIWAVLRCADKDVQAEIFSHLDPEQQVEIVGLMGRDEVTTLLTNMAPDDRVDLFKQLPAETAGAVLPALAQAEREDIRRLAAYKEGTAGAVMTSDYATVPAHLKVSAAIEHLRQVAPDSETIYIAYVVDDHRRLLGYVSLRDLIVSRRDAAVEEIMHRDVVSARVDDDQEDAARKIQKYDLLALPVVDANDALVGIITHDDAIDIITREQTEDMEKLMAIAGSHAGASYLRDSFWTHFKKRVVWVVSLAALGLVSGIIIHEFEHTLMNLLILALYMPMVADTGGNTGSQSATVVVRALALRDISPRDIFRVLRKEFGVAVLLALLLGVLSWAKVMYLSHGVELPLGYSLAQVGAVIAVALGLQVITSTLIGAVLPLTAATLRIDPAVVASPALTTIVDITGLLIYFTTAKLLGI